MLIKVKRKPRPLDAPQRHEGHSRLMTRRQLIGQGFLAGGATLLTGGFLSLFSNPRAAYAALANDLQGLTLGCGISNGAGKIPFICFDLAGGANIAGSNVLVGKEGGQLDVHQHRGLSQARSAGRHGSGRRRGGGAGGQQRRPHRHEMGLAFHADSAFLRGMQLAQVRRRWRSSTAR